MAQFDVHRNPAAQRPGIPVVAILVLAILGCTISDDTGKSAGPAGDDSTFVPCVEGPATEICEYWWDGPCMSYPESEAWCVSGRWGDDAQWVGIACAGGTKGDCLTEGDGTLHLFYDPDGMFIGALVAEDTPVYCNNSYVAQYGEILEGCER